MEKLDAKMNDVAISIYAKNKAELMEKARRLGIEYDEGPKKPAVSNSGKHSRGEKNNDG